MFKQFTSENSNTDKYTAYKSFTLSQADVTRHQFLNNSSNEVSKSYYDFSRINFYLSGSTSDNYSSQFNIGNDGSGYDTFLTKFYDTGSIVFIPQNKFDEGIKRGTFQLVDNETSAIIVDDSNGNLYSTNATFSQSVSALSSSDNYVGNIFYNVGVVTLTETASFNGSQNYTDVTSGDFTITYKGTSVINIYEWTCDTQPNELNDTQNSTVFHSNGLGQLKDNLTESNYPTYISEIGLYDDQKSLVGYARLSKPIPKSQVIPMKFLLRLDY